jgi:hypothetical protein
MENFLTKDAVLPMLAKSGRLPEECPIKVSVSETRVSLFIGPRDWSWNRVTGKLIGAGTCLCSPGEEGVPEQPEAVN